MARLVVLLVATLCCSGAAAEAYLLMDSTVIPTTSKQPTWIALERKGHLLHLPVGESIIPIEPGHYWVKHIDFEKIAHFGFGTVHWKSGPGLFSFRVFPDSITHVGVLELMKGQRDQYGTDYKPQLRFIPELLKRACQKNPDAFAKLPVKYLDKADEIKTMKVRCET